MMFRSYAPENSILWTDPGRIFRPLGARLTFMGSVISEIPVYSSVKNGSLYVKGVDFCPSKGTFADRLEFFDWGENDVLAYVDFPKKEFDGKNKFGMWTHKLLTVEKECG